MASVDLYKMLSKAIGWSAGMAKQGADKIGHLRLARMGITAGGYGALYTAVYKQREYDKAYYGKDRTTHYDSFLTSIAVVGGISTVGAAFSYPFRGVKEGIGKIIAGNKMAKAPGANKAALQKSKNLTKRGANQLMSSAMIWGTPTALSYMSPQAALYTAYGMGSIIGLGAVGKLNQETSGGGLFSILHQTGPLSAIGGVGAGLAVNVNVPRYASAEGNITSAEAGRPTVSRMNFSTAGLVQALHKNRRQG